jgi:hypothetical protein
VSETTDRWRKAARAAVKDARQVADKHLPELRESTRAVIETDLPRVVERIRREFKSRRGG